MNSNNSNAGGWPACEMRAYLNNENSSTSIINSLPEELRNAIIDTMVVSGYHPSSATSNYVSTDKLYLLSPHEVWEDVGTSTLGISALDKSYNNTRQLDYYLKYNTTTVDYSSANKIYDGGSYYWWLRSARYNISTYFFAAASGGNWNNTAEADSADGVSPAFRIG